MSATDGLADHITAVSFDTLPSDAKRVAKHVILDGCANMLAGSQEPLVDPFLPYIKSLNGPSYATIVGHDTKSHPLHVAYANGVFCHAMDFEMMWVPPTHPTSPSLPALLALAEHHSLPGTAVIAALAVAFEVQGRLRLAIDEAGIAVRESLHPPGQVGPLGAAAGCANLLGLTKEQTKMALGIAGSRVSGLMANTGTMTKSTHCGHAARMGLESALLASNGFTASDRILEAPHGYNETLFQGRLALDTIITNFGDPYRMVDPGLIFKKYPSQYPTHWSIDAAVSIRRQHDFDPSDITTVTVEVGANNEAADRTEPASGLAGKFSIAYTVAVALLDGTVDITSFNDTRRFAPDIEALLERIRIEKNPAIDAMDFERAWSRVTTELRDGSTRSVRVDRPAGIWDNPVSPDAYHEKFHHCAEYVLSAKEASQLADHIESVETLDTIDPIMECMSQSGPTTP